MRDNGPVTNIEQRFPDDPSAKIISITDPNGIILDVNDTFEQMSGFSREELIGQPQNIVRHPDMPAAVFANLWKTIQKGESFMGIIKNRCKNGDHYWVNAFIMPIMLQGKIVGYESVRTAATPQQIAHATKYYKLIREGKTLHPRNDTTQNVSYLCVLASIVLAAIYPSYLTNGLSLAVTLGAIYYVIYRKNYIQHIINSCFHSGGHPINTLIYTNKTGRIGEMRYGVLYNLKEVDTILTRVKETSNRLTTIANKGLAQQANSVNASNDRNQKYKEQLQDMTDIASHISLMVNDISNSAKETVQHSNAAANLVSESKSVANQTMSVIDTLSESINKISETITELANRVDDIEKASELIKGIASQTNLLALNASIEAARAGEAGRGFAVVADEVRALSLRTESTTLQIHDLITRFKQTAEATVELASKNKENSQLGVEQIHATNEKLDEILVSIEHILSLINKGNDTIQTQASTAGEVNIKVQHISSMNEANVESGNDNLKQVQEISNIATEINSMVNRFSNKDNV